MYNLLKAPESPLIAFHTNSTISFWSRVCDSEYVGTLFTQTDLLRLLFIVCYTKLKCEAREKVMVKRVAVAKPISRRRS